MPLFPWHIKPTEPHPVVEPKVEDVGSTKLQVCWSRPAEGELTGYRVEWKTKEGSSEEKDGKEEEEKKDAEKEEGEKKDEKKEEEGEKM